MRSYMMMQRGCRYFRMRVPKTLQPYLNQEIRYPIRILDLQTAAYRCKLLANRLYGVFTDAQQGKIQMSILNPFVREICANILYYDARLMTSMTTPADEYENACRCYRQYIREHNPDGAPEFIKIANDNGVPLDPADPEALPLIINYYQGMLETCRILKARASGNLHNGFDGPDEHGHLSSELSPQDATAKLPSPNDLPKLEINGPVSEPQEVLRHGGPVNAAPGTRTLSLSDQLARAAHHVSAKPPAAPYIPPVPQNTMQPAALSNPVPPNIRKVLTLTEGIEAYLKEKQLNERLNPKTAIARRTMLSVIAEIFGGSIKLYEIDREMIVQLRTDVLPRYPWNRSKIYPGKSLPELLKMIPAPKPLGETSQRHYMEYWSMFFNWCVECGYMNHNPAKGVVKKPGIEDLTELRPPFSMQEIRKIFADLIEMPNCQGFQARTYAFRYWIPLIGLYQGMRLNEICQLHLDNVCVVDNIPCLQIKPDQKRKQKVKNSASIRVIPIHSVLLRLNFLGYVLERKSSRLRHNDQLFETLTLDEGGYQRKMQQFNVRIHNILKINSKKSFHSFRHNFDTELSNKESNAFLIQCLDGHARSGELGSRYSKPDIKAMQKTLEKVTYGNLDMFAILKKTPLEQAVITQQIQQLKTGKSNT